jgi:hypothetical protein
LVKRDDDPAKLALEMFSYRVRLAVGAYLAALGTAEAVLFGGGIGEDSPWLRKEVCAGLAGWNVQLDTESKPFYCRHATHHNRGIAAACVGASRGGRLADRTRVSAGLCSRGTLILFRFAGQLQSRPMVLSQRPLNHLADVGLRVANSGCFLVGSLIAQVHSSVELFLDEQVSMIVRESLVICGPGLAVGEGITC